MEPHGAGGYFRPCAATIVTHRGGRAWLPASAPETRSHVINLLADAGAREPWLPTQRRAALPIPAGEGLEPRAIRSTCFPESGVEGETSGTIVSGRQGWLQVQ